MMITHVQFTSRSVGRLVGVSLAIALATGLTACGSDDAASDSAPQASAVEVTRPWVKASPSGMTAAFADITNNGSSDVRVVAASSPAGDRMEIHEMADENGEMVMRAKADGLPIRAHSSVSLTPGHDHLMLMDLRGPVASGDTVTIILTFADESTLKFDAQARDFLGNKENYQPSHGSDTHVPSMRHG